MKFAKISHIVTVSKEGLCNQVLEVFILVARVGGVSRAEGQTGQDKISAKEINLYANVRTFQNHAFLQKPH